MYDLTAFLPSHPGGPAVILEHAGRDATAAFEQVHPPDVLRTYLDGGECLGAVRWGVRLKEGSAAGVEDPMRVVGDEGEDGSGNGKDRDDGKGKDKDREVAEVKRVKRRKGKRKGKGKGKGKAKGYEKPPLEECLNLNDFEKVARRVMSKGAWAYYSSGADDEVVCLFLSMLSVFAVLLGFKSEMRMLLYFLVHSLVPDSLTCLLFTHYSLLFLMLASSPLNFIFFKRNKRNEQVFQSLPSNPPTSQNHTCYCKQLATRE